MGLFRARLNLATLKRCERHFLKAHSLGLMDSAQNIYYIQRYTFSVIDIITYVALLLCFLKD